MGMEEEGNKRRRGSEGKKMAKESGNERECKLMELRERIQSSRDIVLLC